MVRASPPSPASANRQSGVLEEVHPTSAHRRASLWPAPQCGLLVRMEGRQLPRRGIAFTLVVLASLAAFLAIFALWANRQLLNTENWTDTSSKLLAHKVIRDRVATFLVDELYANVDVKGQLQAALPDRPQALAGPAAGALRPVAERGTRELLASPSGQEAWEGANRAAHRLLLRVLEGGGATLSTNNGVVDLDLKQLLREMEARFGVGGGLAGRLPSDAASMTVLRSDQLEGAQDAVTTVKALPIVLIGLSL